LAYRKIFKGLEDHVNMVKNRRIIRNYLQKL